MELNRIRRILLDETSPADLVAAALDDYSRACARVTGITPDAGFDAWREDRFLASGTAINPRAAAHCVTDYRRTLMFVRAVHAALERLLARTGTGVVRVLYAGCGPWATLLLPVLGAFPAGRLSVRLLDVHQSALDGVHRLIEHFGLADHAIETRLADASTWRCPEAPDLIVTETMQKALEQEPQFAVTANLAPQMAAGGIFIPEQIDVDLCLTHAGGRHPLGRVLTLTPAHCTVPEPVRVRIPAEQDLDGMEPELITTLRVFEHQVLRPGDANITLARPCPELRPLAPGARFRVAFRTGTYPVFEIVRMPG